MIRLSSMRFGMHLTQHTSHWHAVFAWAVFAALLIGEQWAEKDRIALQETLDQKVTLLQQLQRQQHELVLLGNGLAPYLNHRQQGETQERIRRLANSEGLQLQQLEHANPNPASKRRSNPASQSNRLVFQGSLPQIVNTLQNLPIQLDAEHQLSLQIQAAEGTNDVRRLRLTLTTHTQDPAQPQPAPPAFWQWLKQPPLENDLGPGNPFLREHIAMTTQESNQNTPLTELELNAYVLVGTLLDPARGQSRALFLLPDNRVISVRIGDAIGRERARILAILPDAIDLVTEHSSPTSSKLDRDHIRMTVHSAPTGSTP